MRVPSREGGRAQLTHARLNRGPLRWRGRPVLWANADLWMDAREDQQDENGGAGPHRSWPRVYRQGVAGAAYAGAVGRKHFNPGTDTPGDDIAGRREAEVLFKSHCP